MTFNFWEKYRDEYLTTVRPDSRSMIINTPYQEEEGLLTFKAPSGSIKHILAKELSGLSTFLAQKSGIRGYKVHYSVVGTSKEGLIYNESKVHKNSKKNSKFVFNKYIEKDREFDTFIESESNSLALSKCLNISKRLVGGEKTNDLVLIYGVSGVGKSHLANAVLNFAKANNKEDKCILFTFQDFRETFKQAAEDKAIDKLANVILNGHEIVIFDDIDKFDSDRTFYFQFLENIVEKFQTTQRNVIFITKENPNDTQFNFNLAQKNKLQSLISRLREGVVCPIERPGLELSIKFLEQTARNKGFFLSHSQAQMIANNIGGTFRDLNGAINNINTTIQAKQLNCSKSTPNEIIKLSLGPLQEIRKKKFTEEKIIENVVEFYRVEKVDLLGKSRIKEFVIPRQVCMYIIKTFTNNTATKIAKYFNRDHTTVTHNIKKIQDEFAKNSDIAQEARKLIDIIQH